MQCPECLFNYTSQNGRPLALGFKEHLRAFYNRCRMIKIQYLCKQGHMFTPINEIISVITKVLKGRNVDTTIITIVQDCKTGHQTQWQAQWKPQYNFWSLIQLQSWCKNNRQKENLAVTITHQYRTRTDSETVSTHFNFFIHTVSHLITSFYKKFWTPIPFACIYLKALTKYWFHTGETKQKIVCI